MIRKAPALLAVGITSFAIDGRSVTLAPPAPSLPHIAPPKEPVAHSHINPMLDPSTYPGGRVPGYTREDRVR